MKVQVTQLPQNEVLRVNDKWYVSYNPNPNSGFGRTLGMFGALLGAPELAAEQPAETALVKGDKFFVLNGDFRDEYTKLMSKGWKACFAFYESKKARYQSPWSSDYRD